MSVTKKLFNSAAWALSGKMIAILCAFLTNILLTRSLAPEEYGAYFVAFNTVIILATVSTLGVDQYGIRLIALCSKSGDCESVYSAVYKMLTMVLCAAFVVALLYWLMSVSLLKETLNKSNSAAGPILVAAWIFFATIQRFLAETFRGFKNVKLATIFGGIRNNGVLISVISSATMISLYLLGYISLMLVYGVMLAASAFIVVCALSKIYRQQKISVGGGDQESSVVTENRTIGFVFIISESWPLWLASILNTYRMQGDSWFAAAYDGAEQVALYGAAQKFVALVMAPLAIVNAILPAHIAEYYVSNEKAKLEKLVTTISGLVSIPAIILMAIMLLYGSKIMAIFFGSFYADGYKYLIVLGVGQLINVLTGACFLVMAMSGNQRSVIKITFMSTMLLIVMANVFGNYWGAFGVAIAASFVNSLHNIMGMYMVNKIEGIWTGARISLFDIKKVMKIVIKK